MEWILSSERLGFRKIEQRDYDRLCAILQDKEIMYAWEHGFTEDEVRGWMEENFRRYDRDGFSYFAAIEKTTGEMVGMIGPLIETIDGKKYIGIAYILDKRCWGKGFAAEGARACMDYAFHKLYAREVIAEIRPENLASRKVAERLGMKKKGEFIKRYYGREMPHWIYSKTK